MAHYLPPPILALFAPRPPLQYLPPLQKLHNKQYTGIAQYVSKFSDVNNENEAKNEIETKYEDKKDIKQKNYMLGLERQYIDFNNIKNFKNFTENPAKTLFVGNLKSETVKNKDSISKTFSKFGKIKKIVFPQNEKAKKAIKYCFVEYYSYSDFDNAYKYTGRNFHIDGKEVIVDREKGRNFSRHSKYSRWLPMRFKKYILLKKQRADKERSNYREDKNKQDNYYKDRNKQDNYYKDRNSSHTHYKDRYRYNKDRNSSRRYN